MRYNSKTEEFTYSVGERIGGLFVLIYAILVLLTIAKVIPFMVLMGVSATFTSVFLLYASWHLIKIILTGRSK